MVYSQFISNNYFNLLGTQIYIKNNIEYVNKIYSWVIFKGYT